jgi:formylglycine-generating enzyme required for sulfatase activity
MKLKIDWVEIPGGKSQLGISTGQKTKMILGLRDAYGIDHLHQKEQALIEALCNKALKDLHADELHFREQLFSSNSPLLRFISAIGKLNGIPNQTVELRTFYISRFPISRAQAEIWYQEPVAEAIGWIVKRLQEYNPSSEGPDRPERFKWDGADALAHWLRGRLPTIFEWEKAARGADSRLYPWGSDWDASKANFRRPENQRDSSEKKQGRITAIDAYPEGASPYGVMDMVGNLSDWTSHIEHHIQYGGSQIYIPYSTNDLPAEAGFFWGLPFLWHYGSGNHEGYVGCRPILETWGRNLWTGYNLNSS